MDLVLQPGIKSSLLVDDIPSEFCCVICMSVMLEPLRDNCPFSPHSFCRPCIEDWLQRHQTCPTSKLRLVKTDLTHNEALTIKLGELETKCRNWDRKCTWVGKVKDSAMHLQTCPKRIVILNLPRLMHPLSKGALFHETLDEKVMRADIFELAAIIMDFSKQIISGGAAYSYNSLAAVQLVFRQKAEPNGPFVFGQRIGGRSLADPRNVDKREVFHVAQGDRITEVVGYRGTKFYPALSFSTVAHPTPTLFGYQEFAQYPQSIKFGSHAKISGIYGEVGWVIGSFGFVVIETYDD